MIVYLSIDYDEVGLAIAVLVKYMNCCVAIFDRHIQNLVHINHHPLRFHQHFLLTD
jgi:hypothetical protein